MTMNLFTRATLVASLFLAAGAVSLACDIEEVDGGDYRLSEESLSCSAISNSVKLCIGDVVCEWTDPHGTLQIRQAPAGGCAAHETARAMGSVKMACNAAGLILEDPECPEGCDGPFRSNAQDANCCTVTSACIDETSAEPEDVAEIE